MAAFDFTSVFQKESFVRTYAFVEEHSGTGDRPSDNITGYGTVSERLVFTAIDLTGTAECSRGSGYIDKLVRTLESASAHGAPFVLFIDGSYGDVSQNVELVSMQAKLFRAVCDIKTTIPLICVVRGKCHGFYASIVSLFDIVVICGENSDNAFGAFSQDHLKALLGPEKTGTGVAVKATSVYNRGYSLSRTLTLTAKDNEALKLQLERLIRLLPDNSRSGAPLFAKSAYVDTVELSASRAPEVKAELKTYAGITTGAITFGGKAPDARKVSTLGLLKAAEFVRFCDAFSIPLVTFMDFDGICASDAADNSQLPYAIASLSRALLNADRRGGRLALVTGNAWGQLASLLLSIRPGDYVYAWDNASISIIDPSALALTEYADEISASDDPVKTRKEVIEKYRIEYTGAHIAAEKGLVDDIIDPSETEARIISYLEVL